MPPSTEPAVYRMPELVRLLGVSKTTVYRWTREGLLPPSVRLSDRVTVWPPPHRRRVDARTRPQVTRQAPGSTPGA